MTRLASLALRSSAVIALAVLVVVPPALVASLIGRPWPDWSTLTVEIDQGNVSDETVMRIAALLFTAIWVWLVATIAAETRRIIATRDLGERSVRASTSPHPGARRPTLLHRLVRIALLGTVTTAATVSTWPTTAFATPSRSLAHAIEPIPPATAPADPIGATPTTPATTTIIADGRSTPLSIAVDLGDETLRDDIVAMNRTNDWNGGVFPEGALITIPVVVTTTTTVGTYTVQPNDGLWHVADSLLGDGTRHHELRPLLDGQQVAPGVVFTADTDTIHPGWVFQRPTEIDTLLTKDDVHVVRTGDTLSSIAGHHLDDPDRWPELWDYNANRAMPDGRTFDDPDLILPGWHIEVPPDGASDPRPIEPSEPDTDAEPPATEPSATDPPPDETTIVTMEPGAEPDPFLPSAPIDIDTTRVAPDAASSPATTSAPPPRTTPSTNAVDPAPFVESVTDTPARSIWNAAARSVWPTLAVGSLLAAGLVATIRRLRNRRLSQLEPGQRLPEPPDGVAGTEQAIRTAAADRPIDTITGLLRSITPYVAVQPEPPAVRAVQVGGERVEILFAEPAPDPPKGWHTIDGGNSWTHRFDETTDEHRQLLTPALVTIGVRTDNNADEVLLDLETAGSLTVAGDRLASIGLARSIALELATYPLGTSMDVHLVGLRLDAADHCDRVWNNTTIKHATDVAERRNARMRTDGATLPAKRAGLDEDDGANDPCVFVVDADALDPAGTEQLEQLVSNCHPRSGTVVVIIGDASGSNERIIVDHEGTALWSGVDLVTPNLIEEAADEINDLLDKIVDTDPEPLEADAWIDALVSAETTADPVRSTGEDADRAELHSTYDPPSFDVLLQLMGEPRAHGVDLTADETELLSLLTCLRHRTEIHIALVHESVGPDRKRKTIENRMSILRRKLGLGADGNDLLPEAAPGRGGRSHYLVSPLVRTDIDLLEHRYRAADELASGEALSVLRDGLELLQGPLLRSRRGYEHWPHSEGVIVEATSIIQAYACRLIELAAEAADPTLILDITSRCSCVLDNPLAEIPIRRAEQTIAETLGDHRLAASVEEAQRRLIAAIDDDPFAEAG